MTGDEPTSGTGPGAGAQHEGSAPVDAGADDGGAESRRTGRTGEFGRVAAVRGAELRRTAATKGQELGRTAASKGQELRRTATSRTSELARTMRDLDVPWARRSTARSLREAILRYGLGPLIDLYSYTRVHGHEHFDELPTPVVLLANHSSHLDTPTILRALPRRWRRRTAVAAAADYFYKQRLVASAVALVFNTVPLLRRGGGGIDSGAFDHVDRLLEQRWNLVMFPEGTRSRDARLGRLRSGAAVIAQSHGMPIVPVRLEGTHTAMPPGQNWPRRRRARLFSRRHRIDVHFGPPVWPLEGETSAEMMARVRPFLEGRDADRRPASNGSLRERTGQDAPSAAQPVA